MIRALGRYSPLLWLRSRRPRSRFFNDERGVSAVEFALILPIMMILYLAGVEVTKAITINRKVTLAARTMSDLVTQTKKVTAADIANVLMAGEVVSGLKNDSNLKMRVSNINIDDKGVAKIDWSRAQNQTQREVGEVVTVPAGLMPEKPVLRSLVWSEVEYLYKPAIGTGSWFGYRLGQEFNLRYNIMNEARLNAKVTCDNC